jgi:hypothetical protein
VDNDVDIDNDGGGGREGSRARAGEPSGRLAVVWVRLRGREGSGRLRAGEWSALLAGSGLALLEGVSVGPRGRVSVGLRGRVGSYAGSIAVSCMSSGHGAHGGSSGTCSIDAADRTLVDA